MNPAARELPARPTKLLLAAVLASNFVAVMFTTVSALTIPWLVLTTTGDPLQTGFVVFAEMAPYVLMQALAGPWVERFGPRRAALAGNLVAGPALLAVPLLFTLDALGISTLVGLVALVGAARGVADCGLAPLVPAAAQAGGTPLPRAAGLHSSAREGAALAGAPVAAVLLTLLEPAVVLLASGFGFLFAALLLFVGLPRGIGAPSAPVETSESYLRRLGAGFGFLFRDPVLRWIVPLIAVTNLLSNAVNSVALPSWVREGGFAPATLGLVTGAFSLGALSGSLLGSWWAPRLRRWPVFAFGLLVGSSPLAFTMALTWSPIATACVALACGLAVGGINPVIGATQYERVPESMLPRVLGAVKACAWTGLPLGPLVGGILVTELGVSAALLAIGSAFLVVTLLPLVVRDFRLLDERSFAASK